jgi:methionine-rich copper-binding protein CopC
MVLKRLSALLVLVVAALLAAASPAMAHAELESSDPSEGASLASAPKQVQLKFGDTVTLPADPIKVTGPGGATWTIGKATIAGSVVTAPVEATGPAGAYVLSWTVIADDGDNAKGELHFSLQTGSEPSSSSAAAAPTSAASQPSPSAAAAATQDSGGFPLWAWILVIVVVVAVVGGLVASRFRRSSS